MELLHVTKAEYVEDYKIYFEFNNGVKGIANLEGRMRGPVFEPHKDIEFFKDFRLESRTITWKNNTDLAPEFLLGLVLKQEVFEKA
jgi:hypothetical protein